MTSPVGSLFNAMQRATSQQNETAVFVTDAMRERLLRGVFEQAYADVPTDHTVFDTNRQWTAKLPALVRLFPDCKLVCCVRNPAWVLDSIEQLLRRNPFELSGIFGFDPSGTVYSRVEGLVGATGMVGFAISALREAVFGGHADRLLLVRYRSLVSDPDGTLGAIYDFIGEPRYTHDPRAVETTPEMLEFDRRLGTPGLHQVGREVRLVERPTVLPPDLFALYQRRAFWEDTADMPPVRIV
jgi:sulfotransferase